MNTVQIFVEISANLPPNFGEFLGQYDVLTGGFEIKFGAGSRFVKKRSEGIFFVERPISDPFSVLGVVFE